MCQKVPKCYKKDAPSNYSIVRDKGANLLKVSESKKVNRHNFAIVLLEVASVMIKR